MQYIGIDFGTSNSLACLAENNKIEFVKYADGNIGNPTILYFPAQSKKFHIGTEAVERYLSNLEDGGIGGRLMLSIKTLLPDHKFDYTLVEGHGRLSAEDLAAKFLSVLKQAAERQFARRFDGVVLGRPVEFSELAVGRLEAAARSAGFKKVAFRLEPVAAAMAYERTATGDELVCVVDIGGGTSDFCIVEVSPSRALSPDRFNDIKAVGGINEAGDELSSKIMKHKLAPRFGGGSTFTSLGKTLPFPAHLINKLSKWHRVNLLNNGGDKTVIKSILPYSNRPADVERLLNLIDRRHGFELFRSIDAAKKQLSESRRAAVRFAPLDLDEAVTLAEFEAAIAPTAQKIEQAVFDSLSSASVKAADIGRVILTGGSSQVPVINRTVIKIFGEEKILRPDYFSSVATGLGYVASSLNEAERKKLNL